MELKQMKYFKTIVEEGTITQAARVLHISQPPLSMQLKAIEEELELLKYFAVIRTLIIKNN